MSGNLSTAEASRVLGLSPARIRALVRSGLCGSAGRGRRYAFDFRDLVVLRAARGLIEARVPAARVRAALASLSRELAPGRTLSGLRVRADGREVAVCDGSTEWQPATGQLLLDLEVDELARAVAGAQRRRAAQAPPGDAAARARLEFERGLDLEDDDPAAAAGAYARALELDPSLADATVNLGRLTHEAGDAAGAARLYRRGIARTPDDPVLHFNLGLALEDGEGARAAAAEYERALELDPDFADAHWNLAGLCEQLGRPMDAIRHYSAYRRLGGAGGPGSG